LGLAAFISSTSVPFSESGGKSTFCNIVCREILIAASVLKFEDDEKQERYETISFREIKDEVKELKVPCCSARITVMCY
jgi:hypothetical protein